MDSWSFSAAVRTCHFILLWIYFSQLGKQTTGCTSWAYKPVNRKDSRWAGCWAPRVRAVRLARSGARPRPCVQPSRPGAAVSWSALLARSTDLMYLPISEVPATGCREVGLGFFHSLFEKMGKKYLIPVPLRAAGQLTWNTQSASLSNSICITFMLFLCYTWHSSSLAKRIIYETSSPHQLQT